MFPTCFYKCEKLICKIDLIGKVSKGGDTLLYVFLPPWCVLNIFLPHGPLVTLYSSLQKGITLESRLVFWVVFLSCLFFYIFAYRPLVFVFESILTTCYKIVNLKDLMITNTN